VSEELSLGLGLSQLAAATEPAPATDAAAEAPAGTDAFGAVDSFGGADAFGGSAFGDGFAAFGAPLAEAPADAPGAEPSFF